MEQQPKVWVVNYAGHDFTKAEVYGEIVPVTKGNVNIFRPDRDLFNLSEILKEFNHKTDYLLLSGNVLINALAVAVLIFRKVTSINFLIYDAKNLSYIKHHLSLDKTKKELKFLRTKEETV